jgi:hypothetical protein
LVAAATVRPADHHLPSTHLAASAAASAAAEFRPVERGSVAGQLYTQVAKVAAQQKQKDKQDKYRRERAASLEKLRTSGEADKLLQRAGISTIGEQLRKQQQEEVDRVARAERWALNRGLAAESVPCLPADLWALIFRIRKVEREQSRAWVEWADRKLMKLVAVWFRTGGQRSSKWLGTLMGKNGGISFASTDAMEDRFRPWCNAILRPGEENSPVHFAGAEGAPARFVDVYVHMLSMMNYAGFHDVIGRLKRILRTFARCLQPGSNVPKYIPGPPDSDDESDTWTAEVPEPGVQPPRPTEKYVTPVIRGEQMLPRAARTLQHQYRASHEYTTLPRSRNDVGPSLVLWNDVGEVSEQNGVGPTQLRHSIGVGELLRYFSDTVSEQYRSRRGAPILLRHHVGVGEVLRYHSDTVSEQYRSRRGAPIRCRSRIGAKYQ